MHRFLLAVSIFVATGSAGYLHAQQSLDRDQEKLGLVSFAKFHSAKPFGCCLN
ncbi:MAG: hypothetical protein AAF664_22945 [Planctomycetota bacterium]